MAQCPGQDQRFWKPDDIFEINCPDCNTSIEFWKDDPQVRCPGCKKMITNPKLDISCAKWCKYAKECLGVSSLSSDSVLSDSLIEEMKNFCQYDPQKIENALETLKYAEMIQSQHGGNPLIVKAAAILFELDSGNSQGPVHAKEILVKHGVDEDITDKVVQIINACLNSIELDSVEYRIVSDAHRLVKCRDKLAAKEGKPSTKNINDIFKTQQGRQLANQSF